MSVTEDVDRNDQLRELVDAIRVERMGADTFHGVPPDWWGPRVFGGMVLAQSLYAAIQTVDPAFRPHSLHGYFIRPVQPAVPSLLRVERLRDSRSFAMRQVVIEQQGEQTSRFCCSFHADESGDEYQITMQDVPGPELLPVSPLHGPFDVCDAGPSAPEPDGTFRSTARLWHRTCGPLGDDPAIHACMMSYFSDMTRTSFRPLSLDSWGTHTDASIDHAVWFHRPILADEWFLSDFQALVNSGGRSVVRGTMYTRDGVLCVSMAQELLIRRIPGEGQPAPWSLGGARGDGS
jgi:acyl-CoA thioesterase II